MKLLKDKKILKKEFLRSLRDGDCIIDEANRISNLIIDQARAEAGQIKIEAQREGFERGKAQATEIICTAQLQKESMQKAFEMEIIDLAVEAASSIIRRAGELDPEIVTDVYHKTLASFESAGRIRLRVSPGDYETAASFLSGEKAIQQSYGKVQVIKDESISDGGCIVESGVGTVDGRIETQLEAIRRALSLNSGEQD